MLQVSQPPPATTAIPGTYSASQSFFYSSAPHRRPATVATSLSLMRPVLNKQVVCRPTCNTSEFAEDLSLFKRIGIFAHKLFTLYPDPNPKREVFVDELATLIRAVDLSHLRLKPAQYPVEYYPIYESATCTMCIFVLRKGTTMPIHDHPRMTVFSRIVSGEMHVRTYSIEHGGDGLPAPTTITDPTVGSPRRAFPATAGMNRVVSATMPESLLIIRPDRGPNIHSFTAVSDEVVLLDIIGPPYNDGDRPCTYFRESIPQDGLPPFPTKGATNGTSNGTSTPSGVSLPRRSKKKQRSNKKRSKSGSSSTSGSSTPEEFPIPSSGPPSSEDLAVLLNRLDTSGVEKMCWLVEDSAVNYECVERPYEGETVADVERFLRVDIPLESTR
ncbi:hypothetical protein HDU85_007108 [Gaertneriomyces sp. JEL0708]|nr:hypothetical protein HDU85_007108 [Gaertneriomyces sp. JEL0708]